MYTAEIRSTVIISILLLFFGELLDFCLILIYILYGLFYHELHIQRKDLHLCIYALITVHSNLLDFFLIYIHPISGFGLRAVCLPTCADFTLLILH